MLWAYFTDYWELYHKITVNYYDRLIYVNEGVTDFDVKVDLYSDLKELWLISPLAYSYSKFRPPLRVIGGDATTGGKYAGDIYFAQHGWRVVYDPTVTKVTGVLYSDDFDSAWRYQNKSTGELSTIYPNEVSNLVQSIEPDADKNEALDYGSRVIVDTNNGTSGKVYPYGTSAQPVNTFADAVIIADKYGFEEIFIKDGNIGIGPDTNIASKKITSGHIHHTVTLAGANVNETQFENLTLEGDALGARFYADSCVILDLDNTFGTFRTCGLEGTLGVVGDANVVLADCYSRIAGEDSPHIDLYATGSSNLSLRRYSGGLRLDNVNDAGDTCTLEFTSGKLHISNTCTAGVMSIRGTVYINDERGASDMVIDNLATTNQLVWANETRTLTQAISVDTASIADAVWDEAYADHNTDGTMGHLVNYIHLIEKTLYVNTESATNGDGSQENPYNNIQDAIDRGELEGILNINLIGDIILTKSLKNFNIFGVGVPEVDFNGQDAKGSHFHQVRIKGNYTNSIVARDCLILNNCLLNGFFENSVMAGNVTCANGSTILMKDCGSYADGLVHQVDINGGLVNFSISGYKGIMTVLNSTNAGNVIDINVDPGNVTIDASCTAGTIAVRGYCTFDPTTATATIIDNTKATINIPTSVINDISDSVWNKLLADMLVADSAGERLNKVLTLNKFLGLK